MASVGAEDADLSSSEIVPSPSPSLRYGARLERESEHSGTDGEISKLSLTAVRTKRA